MYAFVKSINERKANSKSSPYHSNNLYPFQGKEEHLQKAAFALSHRCCASEWNESSFQEVCVLFQGAKLFGKG